MACRIESYAIIENNKEYRKEGTDDDSETHCVQ